MFAVGGDRKLLLGAEVVDWWWIASCELQVGALPTFILNLGLACGGVSFSAGILRKFIHVGFLEVGEATSVAMAETIYIYICTRVCVWHRFEV